MTVTTVPTKTAMISMQLVLKVYISAKKTYERLTTTKHSMSSTDYPRFRFLDYSMSSTDCPSFQFLDCWRCSQGLQQDHE